MVSTTTTTPLNTALDGPMLVFTRNWTMRKLLKPPQDAHRARSSKLCLSEDGTGYRGSVSVSARGNRCVYWSRFTGGYAAGLGHHNYCRNPDQSLMPWCRVRRGKRIVKEFCDIPKCETETELTCGEKTEQRLNKIVGGAAIPIESQPWVAAILHKRGKFLCGGSLIAPCWILTAAHCLHTGSDNIEARHLSVYLGKSSVIDTDADREQKFTVEELIIHQNYNKTLEDFNNDIALLKIKSRDGECAVRTASVRTVCLPPPLTMLPPGIECNIAGFGRERSGIAYYLQRLKQATVTLLSQSLCETKPYYGSSITNNMFCAGSPDWSTDTCQGDSGGPLVCEAAGRMFVFGVVSWGDGCAQKNKPGVYTRITNYNKWIAKKTGLPDFTTGVMYPTK
ncbi:urokinase-type plasminogen activator-like [Diretmus argenteus]